MDVIMILMDRTRIGRPAEPVLGTMHVRVQEGTQYIIGEPAGGSDNETKLPIYLEVSREAVPTG